MIFEALNAKYGDSILFRFEADGEHRLWLIDGGPAGVWRNRLRTRLEQLKPPNEPLTIDLAMLSHVDDDHVRGILDMTKALTDGNDGDMLEILRFWHNSFSDIVGSPAALTAGLAALNDVTREGQSAMATADPAGNFGLANLDERAVAVIASINQGRELRDYITQLGLTGNTPFGGTLSSSSGKKMIDGAQVTVLGPIASRLDKFRQEWAKAAGSTAAMAALFRDDLDESPTNLSSLVLLVEFDGRRILLTGDARGDDILDGFKEAGLEAMLPLQLDILKMPHHGSDRNITSDFLNSIRPNHYVISADGRHGNPDPETIELIVEARGEDEYTLWFTNELPWMKPLLEQLQTDRNFTYNFRADPALTIEIEL